MPALVTPHVAKPQSGAGFPRLVAHLQPDPQGLLKAVFSLGEPAERRQRDADPVKRLALAMAAVFSLGEPAERRQRDADPVKRLALAMAVAHRKTDRKRLLIADQRLMGLTELDAYVPEVLQRAPFAGGVAHLPADHQRRFQVLKRLVESRLLGVHIADAVVHPAFHLMQAGTLCRMQGDLVDLLPVGQVPT